MRVVLQRVREASVCVDERVVGAIGEGMLLLVGFGATDTDAILRPMVEKTLNLRIFPAIEKEFDRSIQETQGGVLVVSQFTLFGDTRKGRRPDFTGALPSQSARVLYEKFLSIVRESGVRDVQSGQFGAIMQVSLINDGPVTFILDDAEKTPTA